MTKTKDVASTISNLPIVAHQGEVELLDAAWNLKDGHTARFRLVESPDMEVGVHPFKRFVRKRGDRVGTRFKVVLNHTKTGEIVDIEMMLMGGGEPLAQGQWVKFWIHDDSQEHNPFAGYSGRNRDELGDKFMVAFVELDEDDMPVNQVKQARVEKAVNGKKQRTLSQYAWSLCNNENFLNYLHEKQFVKGKQMPVEWWGDPEAQPAAIFIRWKCEIQSRGELDSNPMAAKIFHEKIREPYSRWYGISGDGS